MWPLGGVTLSRKKKDTFVNKSDVFLTKGKLSTCKKILKSEILYLDVSWFFYCLVIT